MMKYGSREGVWVVPGIAPSRYTQSPPPRVHLPATPTGSAWLVALPHGHVPRLNYAVGLISVGQLSLCAEISESEGMTEVYNLVKVGRNNNHLLIPGNE